MNLIQKVQGMTDFSLVLLSAVAKIHVNDIIQTRVRQDVREALSTTLLTETGGREVCISWSGTSQKNFDTGTLRQTE